MVMEDAEELEGQGMGRRKAPELSSDTSRNNNRYSHKEDGVLGASPSIFYFLPLNITAFLLLFESPNLK